MNKKKACIESLASQEAQEPAEKKTKYDSSEVLTLSPSRSTVWDTGDNSEVTPDAVSVTLDHVTDTGRLSPPPGKILRALATGDPQAGPTNTSFEGSSKSNHLNDMIFTSKMQTLLHENYLAQRDCYDELQKFVLPDSTGIKLTCAPFPHCVFPNLISNPDYVRDLECALYDLPMRDKNNDLYKFSQSRDLNYSKSSTISVFRSMCEVISRFLSDVTQIPLNSKVDLFCSQYKYTDVLLCHDDELEERRIAFIYYLVPELWSSCDGGTLDLFDMDENGQPKSIVKSIVPKRNSFLFFEVSSKSFHQVAEILTEEKTRLSISGWFHGPPLARPHPYIDPLPPAVPYGSIEEEIFYAWFNPLYLAPEVQTDVRRRFEEDSEIELTDFLQEDKYKELVTALREDNLDWKLLGPANKRNYYSADKEKLPAIVSEFLQVLQSDAAFLVLSNLTGLKLHPLAPTDGDDDDETAVNGQSSVNGEGVGSSRCRSEVRRWEHRCYTLAHDTDTEILEFALDTMMYIGCGQEWSADCGGYTSYMANGEEDELLSVCPADNSLALVYRDKDTMRFVKHLNHRVTKLSTATSASFYEINTVYYE